MANGNSTVPTVQQGTYSVNVASGQMTIYQGSPIANPNQYIVNVPQTMEYIRQPLYSYQSYPAIGSTQFGFFQTQVGGAVTYQDTNMSLQGQLPAPQMFLIDGIGIDYQPGTTAAAPILGPRADAATGAMNDFYTVLKQGYLVLTIGSKPYLQFAPLLHAPPRAHMDGSMSIDSQTTPASALQVIGQVPYVTGPIYKTVPMLLESSQSFNVSIVYPNGAVAIPSTDALARIGVILYGTLYRPAQ